MVTPSRSGIIDRLGQVGPVLEVCRSIGDLLAYYSLGPSAKGKTHGRLFGLDKLQDCRGYAGNFGDRLWRKILQAFEGSACSAIVVRDGMLGDNPLGPEMVRILPGWIWVSLTPSGASSALIAWVAPPRACFTAASIPVAGKDISPKMDDI
jgi:hypothetical protein